MCTAEHYSLFVVCHVGTARLDTLVSTRLDMSNMSSRLSSRVEPSGIWAIPEC